METPTERLRAIRERAEKATPGPWRAVSDNDVSAIKFGDYYSQSVVESENHHPPIGWGQSRGGVRHQTDADFIAHAREDIPWLLDRLSALESAASGAVTDEDAMKKAADAWGCAGEFIDALVGAFAARYPELSPHRDELNERLCKLVAATITASKHSPRLAKAEHPTPPSTDARAALVKKCQSLCVSITDVNAGRSQHCWACQAAALLAADGERLAELERACVAPESREQVVAPDEMWIAAACYGSGGTGHLVWLCVRSGDPLPTWPGFVCDACRTRILEDPR